MSNFVSKTNKSEYNQLQVEIIKLRNVIRYHRDQKGDDRCWLDDELLYETLPEHEQRAAALPTKEIFMEKCTRFHNRRQAPTQIKYPASDSVKVRDQDVNGMTEDEQKKEIARLRQAIRLHRNIGDNKRSWQDDQRLYSALNEMIEYDTKLPELEPFLQSCDRFFSTRGNPPKLHSW